MRAIALAVLLVLSPFPASAQRLRVYFIDVDQGNAALLVAPGGESLLIDSGNDGHGSRIRSVLQAAGVTALDALLTTHYHSDHYGGVDELARSPMIAIGEVYDRGDKAFLPPSKTRDHTYIEYDTTFGRRARHLQRGETIPLGTVTVTCVASGGVALGEQNPQPGHDENDMSVAVLVEWRGFRLFLGGDIEKYTERKIAQLDAVPDVDVYEAGHHGSDSSTSSAFIHELAPTLVIISNGDDAGYQHPRKVTLDTLARLQPAPVVIQTNRYTKGAKGGNVDTAFIADLEPGGPEGTIVMVVDAGTRQYRVTYRDRSRTFAFKTRHEAVARVVLESLLPDPVGPDAEREEVTIRNDGAGPVDLAGWYLQDESGRRWPLTGLGTLAAGRAATTVRRGFPLNLNNNGDTIFLIDPLGAVEDRFTYGPVAEGAVIATGH